MALSYSSGQRIERGDRVRYLGTEGRVEFVVEGPSTDSVIDWHFRTSGPGVMVEEPSVFGRVYVKDIADHLELVARENGK